METREAAEKAIGSMDQSELDGRTIRVNESRPKGSRPMGPGGSGGFNASGREEVKLYVGNLSFDTTQDGVQKLFEQYGTINDIFMPTVSAQGVSMRLRPPAARLPLSNNPFLTVSFRVNRTGRLAKFEDSAL